MSELIIDRVRVFLEQLLPDFELKLFDIQFRREGHGWVLRVFIDCENGVSLEHCSDVSRQLSQYLDVEDFIDHAYSLEVSSPGLERPLRSLDEFDRFCGKKARIKVHEAVDGHKVFEGIIKAVKDDKIILDVQQEGSFTFVFQTISKARLAI